MPKVEHIEKSTYKKISTEGDFRRSTGTFFDRIHIVTEEEEVSKVINIGHRYLVGKHQLEVYVDGQFKRPIESIGGVDYGDYTEISPFTIQFENSIVYKNDLIRFRITWGNYLPVVNQAGDTNANLNQLAHDMFGNNYIFNGDGLRSERGIGYIDSSNTPFTDISKYRTWQFIEDVSVFNFLHGNPDDIRYILFKTTGTIESAMNIRLEADTSFTGNPGDTITIMFDGYAWRELSRSLNSPLIVVPDIFTSYINTSNWCNINYGTWDGVNTRYRSELQFIQEKIDLSANPGLFAHKVKIGFSNNLDTIALKVYYTNGSFDMCTNIGVEQELLLNPNLEINNVEIICNDTYQHFYLDDIWFNVRI